MNLKIATCFLIISLITIFELPKQLYFWYFTDGLYVVPPYPWVHGHPTVSSRFTLCIHQLSCLIMVAFNIMCIFAETWPKKRIPYPSPFVLDFFHWVFFVLVIPNASRLSTLSTQMAYTVNFGVLFVLTLLRHFKPNNHLAYLIILCLPIFAVSFKTLSSLFSS